MTYTEMNQLIKGLKFSLEVHQEKPDDALIEIVAPKKMVESLAMILEGLSPIKVYRSVEQDRASFLPENDFKEYIERDIARGIADYLIENKLVTIIYDPNPQTCLINIIGRFVASTSDEFPK